MSVEAEKLSIPKLSDDNYQTWRIRMTSLLKVKDLYDAVNTDPDPKSEKALAFINLSVEDQFLSTLESCTTAKAAWETLASLYKAVLVP